VTIGRKVPKKPRVSSKGRPKKTKEEMDAIRRENGKHSLKHSLVHEKSDEMEIDYNVEDMYADIYDPRALIAPEMKIHAVAAFFATGTVDGASRVTGLSHQTISEWKNKSEWWAPVMAKIKKEKNDELDAEVTSLIHGTIEELKDRVEHGEAQMYQGVPTGHNKPMTGRDLAATVNTLFDKRAMMRGEPTSISGKVDQSTTIENLKKEFGKMANEVLDKRVVSEQ